MIFMDRFYIETQRVFKDGYSYNANPMDGTYDDKVGIRRGHNGELDWDWWIEPIFDDIVIEKISSKVIFICKLISDPTPKYSVFSQDRNLIFENIEGFQRIEETDSFILNRDLSNILVNFSDNDYEIRETPFFKIFKLPHNLSKEIADTLKENVIFFGVIKNHLPNSENMSSCIKYMFLDTSFNENTNIHYKFSKQCSIYEEENGIVLIFTCQDIDSKFLYIANRGIVNDKICKDVAYLGKGNYYKILCCDEKWDIIDSYGKVYVTCLEKAGSFIADNLIFFKDGTYGVLNISGEVLNIQSGEELLSYRGYIKRNSSNLDVLGNSYEEKYLPYPNNKAIFKFKPVVDDDCFSLHIGGGLYCIQTSIEWSIKTNLPDYSYVVNRQGKIIKDKREGTYIQYYSGLFIFQNNDGQYNVIDNEDNIIYDSSNVLKIIEIPNYPIIVEEIEDSNKYASWKFLYLYNLKGERIFENLKDISDIKLFSDGNILIGRRSEVSYVYSEKAPYFDTDDDGHTYCEEIDISDINSQKITLWGLYSNDGTEILAREYYDIQEDKDYDLLKLILLSGKEHKGFYQIYGYADYTGCILLDPLYEEIVTLTSSILRVKINDRYGLLDYAFRQIIPCRYKTLEIDDHTPYSKFPFFKTENGVLTPTGLLICQTIKARIILDRRICEISTFKNGVAIICNDTSVNLKYGIINHFGEYIVEDKYVKITAITDSIYKCNNYREAHKFDLYQITKDLKAHLIGSYDFLSDVAEFSLGIGKKMDTGSQHLTFGILDPKGDFILDICSSQLGKEKNGYRTIKVANKMGFIDTQTKRMVLMPDANYIGPIKAGIASFAIDCIRNQRTKKIEGGHWGAINKYGEEIIPPVYSKVFTDSYGRIYVAKNSSKIGVVTCDNKLIIPDDYDFLHIKTNKDQIVLAKRLTLKERELYFFNNNGDLQLVEQEKDEDYYYDDYDD